MPGPNGKATIDPLGGAEAAVAGGRVVVGATVGGLVVAAIEVGAGAVGLAARAVALSGGVALGAEVCCRTTVGVGVRWVERGVAVARCWVGVLVTTRGVVLPALTLWLVTSGMNSR
jgi:hypothetical protein